MVVQNASSAQQLFKNHDLSFADRFVTNALKSHGYDKRTIAMGSIGPHWRFMRRIATIGIFANNKIVETFSIRQNCVKKMVQWIEKEMETTGGAIVITKFVFLAAFNVQGNIIFSRDFVTPQIVEDFAASLDKIAKVVATPNVSDIFPVLSWLDLQGSRKKINEAMGEALHILSGFVQERLKQREGGSKSNEDFLDYMLNFEGNGKDEPTKLSEQDINLSILVNFQTVFLVVILRPRLFHGNGFPKEMNFQISENEIII